MTVVKLISKPYNNKEKELISSWCKKHTPKQIKSESKGVRWEWD